MSFAAALAAAGSGGAGPDEIGELAREALSEQQEQQALPIVEQSAERFRSARLWQWAGLLHRALDEHAAALECLQKAAALDPGDAGIAHGLARVALEAGRPAVELFKQALRLAPGDPDLLLGLAAAKLAAGTGEEAERDLEAALASQPLWLQGHVQLAQLRSMLGRRDATTESIEQSLQHHPGAEQLWTTLFNIAVKSSDFQTLAASVTEARKAGVPEPLTLPFEFIAAAENGETQRADALLARIDEMPADPVVLWRIRHLLRSGRADQTLPVIDSGLASAAAPIFWPYASIAWRIVGDPRSDWLEGDSRLVTAIDLPFEPAELEQLATRLRALHVAKGEYLDQSVRGGTQTDGPLLSRVEPEIRALRSKIVDAVRHYVAQLPEPDPHHPLLGRRRDAPIRFSGSWSVRLRAKGRHANHVHPQGWISSALYVSLPQDLSAGERKGWLTLGSPPEELGLKLEPVREVEPVEGRLALFPSWMWHGTIPFAGGERLTVAFDVRPPM